MPGTKVPSGYYKGNSRYYKANHFVVFGQTDRMEIYQFIVSIKITYSQISYVIEINLGS